MPQLGENASDQIRQDISGRTKAGVDPTKADGPLEQETLRIRVSRGSRRPDRVLRWLDPMVADTAAGQELLTGITVPALDIRGCLPQVNLGRRQQPGAD